MSKAVLLAVLTMAVAAPALAQSMNAESFYRRAVKLQNKGPLALFQRGELNALMNEVEAASDRAKANRSAAVEAGRSPRFCPPASGRLRLNSSELMRGIGAIPQGERQRIDMTEAMTRFFAGKFPC